VGAQGVSIKTASAVADLVNKLAVTAALLVGGGWAIYKFALTESPSAQLELAQLKRLCAERGSLDIKLEASSARNVLHGTVIIKNIGTRGVELHFEPSVRPISVARIEFSPDAEPTPAEFITSDFPYVLDDNKLGTWSDISILPGRTNDLHFVVPISRPGYYLISFRGGKRLTAPDVSGCGEAATREESAVWGAATIYFVSDPASVVSTKDAPVSKLEGPVVGTAR
jgi:hypothetical protein